MFISNAATAWGVPGAEQGSHYLTQLPPFGQAIPGRSLPKPDECHPQSLAPLQAPEKRGRKGAARGSGLQEGCSPSWSHQASGSNMQGPGRWSFLTARAAGDPIPPFTSSSQTSLSRRWGSGASCQRPGPRPGFADWLHGCRCHFPQRARSQRCSRGRRHWSSAWPCVTVAAAGRAGLLPGEGCSRASLLSGPAAGTAKAKEVVKLASGATLAQRDFKVTAGL